MEKKLTKSFIKIDMTLWVSYIFMILVFLNSIAVHTIIEERSLLDLKVVLSYVKQHSILVFLIISSFFLVLSANKKLVWSYTILGVFLISEMVYAVFLNFDKYIIFNIFISFTILFYYFHILKNELYSSYFVKNFSKDHLRRDLLVPIIGCFDGDESFKLTITNWDQNGFFAKLDILPDVYDQITLEFDKIKIVIQSSEIYYFNKTKKHLGCKVNDEIWKEFVQKLSSLGMKPEFIR